MGTNTAGTNRIRYVLFDLDGTLTDPGVGITNSVAYALERFGIRTEDKTSLYPYIGPPLMDSFRKYAHLSAPDSRKAIAYYREYFTDRRIFENEVYPGIPEMLSRLRSGGKTLILATSKPEPFVQTVLTHFGLDGFFAFTAGATLDEKRTTKPEVIRYAMDLGGFSAGQAVMVGDREHDIHGAKENGMYAVGVLYGYGSREELICAGADALAEKPENIPMLPVFAEAEGKDCL